MRLSKPAFIAAVWHSPGLLLLAVGMMLGLNFPLGKIALGAGVSPIVWAAVIATGSALILGLAVLLIDRPLTLDRNHLRYFAVTALVSYALPNILVFALIPRVGSGYTAIFFALSPMITVALSLLARLRSPSPLELTGVAIGIVGALLVGTARGEMGRSVDWLWVVLGLVIPLSLAAGNVYRTLDWPKEAHPLWLAVGSNVVAAVLLTALSVATAGATTSATLVAIPGIVAAQVAASATMFALFFRLQAIGGPVTLSQIGTVAAGVGIIAGTIGFGERYSAIVWTGVAVIAAGIALTLRARLRA